MTGRATGSWARRMKSALVGFILLAGIGALGWWGRLEGAHASASTMQPFQQVHTFRSALRVGGGTAAGARVVPFWLPPSMASKIGQWYVLEAHLRIRLAPRGNFRAMSEVDVGVNGKARIQIDLDQTLLGNRVATWWGIGNLFTGYAGGFVFGQTVDLRLRDYLPYHALRLGLNTLYLQRFQFAGHVIQRVALLPGTRIEHSELSPARLSMSASVSRTSVHVGDKVTVFYHVRSNGFPARGVGVMTSTSRAGLAELGTPSRFLGWVVRRDGGFVFEAMQPGVYKVLVTIRSATGIAPRSSPTQILTIHVN
jgi:hypothetical protein